MKDAFILSMQHIYPGGVDNMHQMRDLVRVYSMGWCDALMARGDKAAVQAWCTEFGPISATGWFPDATWKWWTGPTPSIN